MGIKAVKRLLVLILALAMCAGMITAYAEEIIPDETYIQEYEDVYVSDSFDVSEETVEDIDGVTTVFEESVYEDQNEDISEVTVTEIEDVGYLKGIMKLDEDEYFVLGDDRENSEDSRHSEVGNVKRKYIYGKAWFVISGENIGFVKE